MPAAVVAVASVIVSVGSAVAAVIAPVVASIAAVVGTVVVSITSALAGVTAAIGSALGSLVTSLKTAVTPLINTLKGAIETIAGAIDAATSPILTPIKDGLALVNAKLKAVDAWMVKELAIVHDAIQIASAAATVKLLVDLVKGQASISEIIGKVAEGKSFETAVAIARLSKSIVTLGVGIVDRIDTNWELIKTEVETWPDQFMKELDREIEKDKVEILSLMTPRLDHLGRYQGMLTRDIAKVYRHIEDEAWFAAMLVRILR